MLNTFWSIRFEKERQKEDFSLFVTSFIPLIVSKENLPKQDVLLLKQKVELVPLSVLSKNGEPVFGQMLAFED